MKKIDIEVSIQGFIANVRSDLHYINDSDGNLETKFLFPLDSDSAVYKFEAEIDGRTIVAEVQEKSQVHYEIAISGTKQKIPRIYNSPVQLSVNQISHTYTKTVHY